MINADTFVLEGVKWAFILNNLLKLLDDITGRLEGPGNGYG